MTPLHRATWFYPHAGESEGPHGLNGSLWLKFRLKTLELADGAAKAVRVRPEAKSGTRGGTSINSLSPGLRMTETSPVDPPGASV